VINQPAHAKCIVYYFSLNCLILFISRFCKEQSYGYEVFKFDRLMLFCDELALYPLT